MSFDQHGGIKGLDKKHYNLSDADKHIRWIVVNVSMCPLDACLYCSVMNINCFFIAPLYTQITACNYVWGVQLTNVPDILQVA